MSRNGSCRRMLYHHPYMHGDRILQTEGRLRLDPEVEKKDAKHVTQMPMLCVHSAVNRMNAACVKRRGMDGAASCLSLSVFIYVFSCRCLLFPAASCLQYPRSLPPSLTCFALGNQIAAHVDLNQRCSSWGGS